MKKKIKVKIEDFGTLTLENVGGAEYDVYKSNGICIGSINANDYEDWSTDPVILASIIEDAIDNGIIGGDDYDEDTSNEDYDEDY